MHHQEDQEGMYFLIINATYCSNRVKSLLADIIHTTRKSAITYLWPKGELRPGAQAKLMQLYNATLILIFCCCLMKSHERFLIVFENKNNLTVSRNKSKGMPHLRQFQNVFYCCGPFWQVLELCIIVLVWLNCAIVWFQKISILPHRGSRKFQMAEGCERGKFPKGRGAYKELFFPEGLKCDWIKLFFLIQGNQVKLKILSVAIT